MLQLDHADSGQQNLDDTERHPNGGQKLTDWPRLALDVDEHAGVQDQSLDGGFNGS